MMSENDKAQDAMDRLLGIGGPRTVPEPSGQSATVKPDRNAVYTKALIEAQALYPNDGIARHRYAMRAADRVGLMHLHPGRTPSEEERKTIDAALLEAFPEDTAGERGRLSIVEEFPDHITARGVDGKLYMISYTVKDGGVLTFGSPQEVEQTDSGESQN